jgi:hypothetical protein
MPEKPTTADGYPRGQVARVKATCLYLATKLGDLMPELVVVGGLVPSLLIDQQNLPENVTPHVGTLDLDLGLAFALGGEQRYQEVAERLRNAQFSPDENDDLYYLLRNYGRDVSDVAAQLRPLLPDASAVKALEYLRADFDDSEGIRPSRVAEFLFGRSDAALQADAVGFIRQLLDECKT